MFSKVKGNYLYEIYPLATKVLAVAVCNLQVKDWAAYIDSVPGENHENEFLLVAQHGEKLSYNLAKLIFGHLKDNFYWRD